MKTVSLTPRAAMPRLAELAKPLATKAAEFLTSQSLSIVLGVVALTAIMSYLISICAPHFWTSRSYQHTIVRMASIRIAQARI